MSTLVSQLLGALPDAPPPADPARLEQALAQLYRSAREAYPEIDISSSDFLAYVAARVEVSADLVEAVTRLRGDDLYLACGCMLGNEAALAKFDGSFSNRLEEALGSHGKDRTLVEEVSGRLRHAVLFGEGNKPPKISEYSGRGDLWRWYRIVAVRSAIDHRRRRQKQVGLGDDALARIPATHRDPEVSYFRKRYRREFEEVFRESLATLNEHQRNLLRLHYLDGLNVAQIGDLFRIHRATAARRIAKARASLLSETRRRFLTRLQVGASSFESIMRMVQSQLDISISRFLR